ncbi:Hypothetical predicted protein [Pelobates cultripes]|uniref:Uncharacterized protein n=1 Tax=Pelobates cultripes TaxID=61616 RepID=A0AAD1R0Y5_PELCU|nr:Hypothetical predicted protein [Pelobates cultripes]CAH2221711.1 Hypothetical predicted protein [Pelobates cultripes]
MELVGWHSQQAVQALGGIPRRVKRPQTRDPAKPKWKATSQATRNPREAWAWENGNPRRSSPTTSHMQGAWFNTQPFLGANSTTSPTMQPTKLRWPIRGIG